MINAKEIIDEAVAEVNESGNSFVQDMAYAVDKFDGLVSSVGDVGLNREWTIDFESEADVAMFTTYMKGKAKLNTKGLTVTVSVPVKKIATFVDYTFKLPVEEFLDDSSVDVGSRTTAAAVDLVNYRDHEQPYGPTFELTQEQKRALDSLDRSDYLVVTLDTKGKFNFKLD